MSEAKVSSRSARKPDVIREAGPRHAYGFSHNYLSLLGLAPLETIPLLQRIDDGLDFAELEHLQRALGMPLEDVADLIHISPRTLSRRRETGRLMPDESDRLVRLSRVFGSIIELFAGNEAFARHWFASPQMAFGGRSPASLAKSETGSREVENLIGRLEHGVFS